MTVLVGDNTNTTTINVGPNTYGDIEFNSYTAAASGSATDGYFYTTQTGFSFVIAVYNSAATTLLGTSSEVTSSISGWNHATFSPSVSIVSGTAYILSILSGSDTSSGWQMGLGATTATTWKYYNPTSAFFPTPPASLPAGSVGGSNNISLYLASASAVTHPNQMMMGALRGSPRVPIVAATMFMPLSWTINRRNKRAAERRAVRDILKR